MVDFLLVLIELFSPALMVEGLRHYELILVKIVLFERGVDRLFVRSLLRAGVQPTLDPSAETFMSIQCSSPGRGGELVGVCGVCASCVGWRRG